MTLEAAVRFIEDIRRHGKIIVFTNGVYDLLHPGHVRYLQAARTLGDALIIGVNSDRSVRAIKGPTRPITPENERAEIIKAIQPDILVKGADWAENAIVGRETVEARGGRVVRMPVEEGWSTTGILSRLKPM
jgi:D-beta-D-heptose 7-phosphate kinase/D-beta-D-heptose 1-phosphate adenosyltransferase